MTGRDGDDGGGEGGGDGGAVTGTGQGNGPAQAGTAGTERGLARMIHAPAARPEPGADVREAAVRPDGKDDAPGLPERQASEPGVVPRDLPARTVLQPGPDAGMGGGPQIGRAHV